MTDKLYKLELELELSKGYDELEKQKLTITVDSLEEATEIWKSITAIFHQYSKVQTFRRV